MMMQNTPTHITKAEISRSETTTRCMNAQKLTTPPSTRRQVAFCNMTHMDTQSAPTGGRGPLTPTRFSEHTIARPQTTPDRTSKIMDPRAALVRRPTSTYRHSRRLVRITSFRHASPLPPERENVIDRGRRNAGISQTCRGQLLVRTTTEAQAGLKCQTQRHTMKKNDRQSSHPPTRGRRHNNHTRTWRQDSNRQFTTLVSNLDYGALR